MSVYVVMEKITQSGTRNGLPVLAVTSRHNITHCLTYVSSIDDFIGLDGDFVIPDFEFRVDNTINGEYFPNYPACRNFQTYYDSYIKGDRVHIDVHYVTATSNISIFYGALESVIPSINFETAELTFRAIHIIKRALTELTMSYLISKDPYAGDRRGSVWEKYFDVANLLPTEYGLNQTIDYTGLPDYLTTTGAGSKKNYQLLRIHKANLEKYDTQLDFLGDFLRAMSSVIVWHNNKFSCYSIGSVWTANATVALDAVLTEISRSEPWEDHAEDVTVDAGDTKLSYKDFKNKVGDYGDGRRVYTSIEQRKKIIGLRSKMQNSNSSRVISAAMVEDLRMPTMYYSKISGQYRGDHKYTILLADIIMPYLAAINYSHWCLHRVKLDVEAEGLGYYPGRQYSISGTAYKCTRTDKDLENETTKLTLVGA